jgi:hypothetical protein
MRKYLVAFILGFLASTFAWLTVLSFVTIPEYIIEVECKRGLMT